MDKGGHTIRYLMVWNLLGYDSTLLDRFDALRQSVDQNCVGIVVVGTNADLERLKNARKMSAFIQYIKIDGNDRRTVIWERVRFETSDSIILDSDIYVSTGWIKRLIDYAYSDDSISGAVPIEVRVENISDVQELSRLSLVERREKDEINVETAHCLFLKRKILYKFRKSEKEVFSDLSEKLRILGGKLVRCDDVLVGSVSTPQEHKDIIKKMQLLSRMKVRDGKKNILYFLLADFREDAFNNMGGTQLHVKDLTLGLKNKYNIIVAARDQEYLRVTEYYDDERISFKFYIGPIPQNTIFYDKRCAEVYRMVLEAFCIDIVHVHHTMWMTLDIFAEAEALKIPVIFTMHDYYAVCPVLTMVDMNGNICTEKKVTEECTDCLKIKKNIAKEIDYISLWREEELLALEKCSCIIAPSNSVKRTIGKYYPSLYDKTMVINHGIVLPEFDESGYHTEFDGNRPLRVAFIGDLGKQKGSELIYDIIVNSSLTEYQWFLIGGIGDEKLFHLKQKNLVKHGWYKKEELGYLVRKYEIDLVCILSLVPETYSYTFSEAMANKIPLVVTDIGALGERIREHDVGWVISSKAKYQEVLSILSRIREDPKEYMEKKVKLGNVHHISIHDMLNKYISLYDEYPKKECVYECNLVPFFKGYIDEKIEEDENIHYTAEELVRNLQQEIEIIKNSSSYKTAKIWEECRIPGKAFIEKIIIAVLNR